MNAENTVKLKLLLLDIKSLRESMERIIDDSQEGHVKWVTYKRKAKSYSEIAQKYYNLTKDLDIKLYDTEKLPGSMDTVWPFQKEVFENVYADLIKMQTKALDLSQNSPSSVPSGLHDLLHPKVMSASMHHYTKGDYRSAVLDAIIAVCDEIRLRTKLDLDGENLFNQAFSPNAPLLIFSEIATESGKNDQKGFMDIFKGFYRGVRNPKAHSLVHDLDAQKSAQYLVLASILMRRVIEAASISDS